MDNVKTTDTAMNKLKQLAEQFALQYNKFSRKYEVNGHPLSDEDVDNIRIAMDKGASSLWSRDIVLTAIRALARERAYDPAQDFLKNRLEGGGNQNYVKALVEGVLGTTDPLDYVVVKKFLLGIVARIMEPGIKFDYMLTLYGKQGIGKSTFWKELLNPEWYTDSFDWPANRDELAKLGGKVIVEMGEMSAFRKADNAAFKHFLSQAVDSYRQPYGMEVKEFERQCVFVGTSNAEDVLKDETGNRRHWSLRVPGKIDLAHLVAIRDGLWGQLAREWQSFAKMRRPVDLPPFVLLAEEAEKMEERNDSFMDVDPWTEPVLIYLEDKPCSITSDVLTYALQISIGQQTKAHKNRVGAIARRAGYSDHPRSLNGEKKHRVWAKPEQFGNATGNASFEPGNASFGLATQLKAA